MQERDDYTVEPVWTKMFDLENLEPWDTLVCSLIRQSIEDLFEPKIYGEHVGGKLDKTSPKYAREIEKYRKAVSLDAEDFFFSETLDYWVGSLSTPLDPNLIRKMIAKMMTTRTKELEIIRQEPVIKRNFS